MVYAVLLSIFFFQKQANQDFFSMWKKQWDRKLNTITFLKKHYHIVIINENLFAFCPVQSLPQSLGS